MERLPDGYGFLQAPDYNYVPGPDDIYVSFKSNSLVLAIGDTIEGINSPTQRVRKIFRYAPS